jgi:uncharacterized integral membrane protein (TIGR00698 family)
MKTQSATPAEHTSLDSFEGLPVLKDITSPPGPPPERGLAAYGWLEKAGGYLPGVALAGLLAVGGGFLSVWLGEHVFGFEKSPVSEIMMAIFLGLLIRNTVGLPELYYPGLQFCLKTLLRLGIILLGLRLSLLAAGKIGLVGLPVVVVCITAALLLVTWFNARLGLPRRLGALIAVGTSICGATAIVATAPAIKAEDDEVSYAVACITIFGLVAMLAYPFLAFWIFAGDARLAGLFLGTAIHETAQVAGAGLMYQQQFDAPQALDVATVTKLVRNLCMAAVIPIVAVYYHRGANGPAGGPRRSLAQMFPLFIAGFFLMTIVRTVGDIGERPFGVLDPEGWKQFVKVGSQTAAWLLTIAMASVGLGTSLSRLLKLGLRPLAVGLVAAVLVGVVSVAMVKLVGPLL